MPCYTIGHGSYLCCTDAYKYKGYYFQWHNYTGPCALRKDGEPSRRNPAGFWDMIEEFAKMTDEEKEVYRV